MARKLRVQYPGASSHVMNRGNHREGILRSNNEREIFVQTLGQCCGKTNWQVHAWRLMSNHFHWVVETPRANLVAGRKWLLGRTNLLRCALATASLLLAALAEPAVALPPGLEGAAAKSPLSLFVVQPTRLVWTTDQGVENAANLLKSHSGQAVVRVK